MVIILKLLPLLDYPLNGSVMLVILLLNLQILSFYSITHSVLVNAISTQEVIIISTQIVILVTIRVNVVNSWIFYINFLLVKINWLYETVSVNCIFCHLSCVFSMGQSSIKWSLISKRVLWFMNYLSRSAWRTTHLLRNSDVFVSLGWHRFALVEASMIFNGFVLDSWFESLFCLDFDENVFL